MNLVVLVLASFVGVVTLGAVADLLWGSGHWWPAIGAAGVCLPPAMVTLAATEFVGRRSPQSWAAMAILGGGFRGMAAIVGVVMFDPVARKAGVAPGRFAGWVAAVYMVTLAAETAVLAWSRRARHGNATG